MIVMRKKGGNEILYCALAFYLVECWHLGNQKVIFNTIDAKIRPVLTKYPPLTKKNTPQARG